MHKYTIYDKTTGEVLRSGSCSNPADIPLQVQNSNESLLPGVRADDSTHRVNLKTERLNLRPMAERNRLRKERDDHLAKAEGLAPLYAKLLADRRG